MTDIVKERHMKNRPGSITRRTFLFTSGLASAGIGMAGCASTARNRRSASGIGKTQEITGRSTVSLGKSNDRRQAAYDALKPLQSDVARAIGEKQVIIKVNAGFPSENHRIHSTHPDHIRGILDFLREFYDGNVWIAEGVGSSDGTMMDGFELYGYMQLAREYGDITFVDANQMPYEHKWIHQWHMHPTPINIISMYYEPDKYIISAARLKTHNAVVSTYSLKNVVMGSPVGSYDGHPSEKGKMHGATPRNEGSSGRELSYNMFTLATDGVYPDLAVVDGVTGIEGDGPWDGTEVEHNICVASTDFVACDRVCTEIMGVDPFYMKYLEWCGDAGLGNWDMKNIRTVGANLQESSIKYEMNPSMEQQVAWIDEHFKR